MASSIQTLPRGSHLRAKSGSHGFGITLKRLWNAYWAHRAQSATVFLLRGLDDRTLQDIGVERSEIESVVYSRSSDRLRRYHPAWR
jgi:uncharacterized protein YjiS (DUF1127 family)